MAFSLISIILLVLHVVGFTSLLLLTPYSATPDSSSAVIVIVLFSLLHSSCDNTAPFIIGPSISCVIVNFAAFVVIVWLLFVTSQ